MKHCAFLSLSDPANWVIDDSHAIEPLRARGWTVNTVPWSAANVSWGHYDAVVIRSTWDYWHDPHRFIATLREIGGRTRVANPLTLVRWNLAKTYLRDLARRGVSIVPTGWLDGWTDAEAAGWFEEFASEELVLKPLVGANGDDAFRLAMEDQAEHRKLIAARLGERPCLVQPFRPSILAEGEFSLVFFNGSFSHAILKRPAPGEFRSQEERGADILPVTPEPELLACAQRCLATLGQTPLYARADFVRGPAAGADGAFELMELELVEPSLYLRTDPDAPERFADALVAWGES
jgi:glutathione synthase/RimK-type ligase-like ATP-grasp enzyme